MDEKMNDFFQQKVNFAIVINCDLVDIEQLKRFLADEGLRLIYQKTSISKLIIKEENSS